MINRCLARESLASSWSNLQTGHFHPCSIAMLDYWRVYKSITCFMSKSVNPKNFLCLNSVKSVFFMDNSQLASPFETGSTKQAVEALRDLRHCLSWRLQRRKLYTCIHRMSLKLCRVYYDILTYFNIVSPFWTMAILRGPKKCDFPAWTTADPQLQVAIKPLGSATGNWFHTANGIFHRGYTLW